MKLSIIVLIFVLNISFVFSQIQINEVMYNPTDSNEWIEIKLTDDFDFINSTLKDNYYEDEVTCCNFKIDCTLFFQKNNLVVIFDQDTTFNISNIENFLCVDDNSIGNGLGNNEDNLTIKKNNKTIDNVVYGSNIDKGKTLSKINSTWVDTSPTPGKENIILFELQKPDDGADLEINIDLSSNIFPNIEYKLFKIKNNNYPEYNNEINITFFVNITKFNELIFSETYYPRLKSYTTTDTGKFEFDEGNFYLCGEIKSSTINETNIQNNKICKNIVVSPTNNISCNISLETQIIDDQIFQTNNKIKFKHQLSNQSFPFIIEYWIEDLFGNTVKNKVETTNTNSKSFTPKINEKDRIFLLKSKLDFIACNNSNSKQYDEQILLVKNTGSLNQKNSDDDIIENEIVIIGTDKEEYFFGDEVMVNLYVKKGDSSKTVVNAKIKAKNIVSPTTKTYYKDKNTEYEIKFPILLNNNCDEKYNEGKYELVIEGLGTKTTKQINLKNSNQICYHKEPKQSKITNSNYKLDEFELIYFTNKSASNDEIISMVQIFNNDNVSHNYSIYSYVYNGPKSYSGSRTLNMQNISIIPGEKEVVFLKNNLQKEFIGKANLKIRMKKDTDKTQKEITSFIEIFQKNESMIKDSLISNHKTNENNNQGNRITGGVVYESKSAKIKNYSFVFVVFIILLFIFLLVKDYL